MDLVEAAALQAPLDLARADTGFEELPPRNHPMLAPGKRGNDPICPSSE
jgi:hypothetical protein